MLKSEEMLARMNYIDNQNESYKKLIEFNKVDREKLLREYNHALEQEEGERHFEEKIELLKIVREQL